MLCSVALVVTAPSRSTGSKIATGLTNPDLEVFHSMSVSVVSYNSSAHFKAIIFNGNLEVAPNSLP